MRPIGAETAEIDAIAVGVFADFDAPRHYALHHERRRLRHHRRAQFIAFGERSEIELRPVAPFVDDDGDRIGGASWWDQLTEQARSDRVTSTRSCGPKHSGGANFDARVRETLLDGQRKFIAGRRPAVNRLLAAIVVIYFPDHDDRGRHHDRRRDHHRNFQEHRLRSVAPPVLNVGREPLGFDLRPSQNMRTTANCGEPVGSAGGTVTPGAAASLSRGVSVVQVILPPRPLYASRR